MRLLLSVLVLCGLAVAQSPDLKTVSGSSHALFKLASANVIKAAEKMPEENYAFKPVEGVRTFGQMVGHIADAQYFFCASAKGEQRQSPGVEKNMKTKAEIVAGLKEAVAYCESVYASTNDTNGAEVVKFRLGDRTRLGVLGFNNIHVYEHYGNLVTYMRMKGMVPPSSEGR